MDAMEAESFTETNLVRASWEIRPRDGGPIIRGDLRARPGAPPSTAVIVCHGFKGFRRWGFFPNVCRAIAAAGHAVVSFDFSHNGIGEDGVDFSALDRFAAQTHSRNLDEIRLVLDAATSGSLFPKQLSKVALLGHSRGGAEALLAAATDQRVSALVTWAAVSSLEGRWNSDQIEIWKRGGTVEILNARTGQAMPIGPGYWADLIENRQRLDVLGSVSRLEIPWLIVHGESDETVSVSDARNLFAAAGERAELCLVEGAGHTFGATHPYTGPTPELRTAIDTTIAWLDVQLR
jgi:uncharacterized protein